MDKLKELYLKYKEIFWYLVFGGLTTLINIGVYAIFYNLAHLPNVPSNVIAWFVSVLFAYITNKIFVFNRKKNKGFIVEILLFFLSRLGTGLLDTGIMYVTVDIWQFNELLMKVISNVIVIILNYFFSKFLVFRKGKKAPEQSLPDAEIQMNEDIESKSE